MSEATPPATNWQTETFPSSRPKSGAFDVASMIKHTNTSGEVLFMEWQVLPHELGDTGMPRHQGVAAQVRGLNIPHTTHFWGGDALVRFLDAAAEKGVLAEAAAALPKRLQASLEKFGGASGFLETRDMQKRLDGLMSGGLAKIEGPLDELKVVSALDDSVVLMALTAKKGGYDIDERGVGDKNITALNADAARGVSRELTQNPPNDQGRRALKVLAARILANKGRFERPFGAEDFKLLREPAMADRAPPGYGPQHEAVAAFITYVYDGKRGMYAIEDGARLEKATATGALSIVGADGAREKFDWPAMAVLRYNDLLKNTESTRAAVTINDVRPAAEPLVRGDTWGGIENMEKARHLHTMLNGAHDSGLGLKLYNAPAVSKVEITDTFKPFMPLEALATFEFDDLGVTHKSLAGNFRTTFDQDNRAFNAGLRETLDMVAGVAGTPLVRGIAVQRMASSFSDGVEEFREMVVRRVFEWANEDGELNRNRMQKEGNKLAEQARLLKKAYTGEFKPDKPGTKGWAEIVFWSDMSEAGLGKLKGISTKATAATLATDLTIAGERKGEAR